MAFNSKEHLTKLSGKDYLEVKFRIVWFRDEHPDGLIDTELLHYEEGFALVKAMISIDGKLVATGTANADSRKKKAMWSGKEVMKAETAAIGRALAHAGYGTQFTGETEGEFLADSPVKNGNSEPPPEAPTVLWPSSESVKWVMDAFRGDMDLSNGEILKLARVTALDDGDGWRKYATPQAAVKAIQAAFDNATAGQGNEPMTATFNYMSYVGKGGTLLFATSDPTKGDHTIATLWGGRGAIKKMYGNDELHEQLELSQYDAIKDKQAFSDWKQMTMPVDFEFVSERSNNRDEDYFKITGIKGDPVIPF